MQAANAPDLVSVLPEELFFQVTSFLDVSSLLTMRTVNQRCYVLCAKDSAGWTNLCEALWENKIFVCRHAKELFPTAAMQAYRISVHDAKNRQNVRPNDEFLFDPETETGPIYHFRFKEAAGPDWTSWDPWWSGQASRKMVFLRDGTICQYLCQGEDYQHDLLLRNPTEYGRTLPKTGNMMLDPPVSMKWRFCEKPMDLPVRDHGSYIRLAVGGRDVPTYVMRRSPTGNWGFMAESCWGVYTSFEMPRKRMDAAASGDSGDTENNAMDTSSSQQQPASTIDEVTRKFNLLADDSTFIITNEVQWREALLYNFGATVLPEGDTAAEDFDRMFGQTLQHRAAGGTAGGVVVGMMDPQVAAGAAPAAAAAEADERARQQHLEANRYDDDGDDFSSDGYSSCDESDMDE